MQSILTGLSSCSLLGLRQACSQVARGLIEKISLQQDPDVALVERRIASRPDSRSVAEDVHRELSLRSPIGRMRVQSKGLYNCNSWHRDPEPRLHIPIVTNPGSLFVLNHHVTHLPADGSVYFTDTRGYHTALNGGETRRVHIVAALAYPPVTR